MGESLHATQPGLPISVGLAGVTSLAKLIRFSMMCGVGPSMAALSRGSKGLLKVISDRNPADVLDALAARYPQPSSPLDLHFFPFGGWEKTLAWFEETRRMWDDQRVDPVSGAQIRAFRKM